MGGRRRRHGLARVAGRLAAVLLATAVVTVGASHTGTLALTATTQVGSTTMNLPNNPTLMAGQVWMIKSNDLFVMGEMGSYEWVGCGLTTAPLTKSNYIPCQSGQDPIYTSYETLKSDIAANKLASGTTIIFDNESGWNLTPKADKKNPVQTVQNAVALAHANGLSIIAAPFANPGEMIREDVAAAKAGADAVDIQAQAGYMKAPASYRAVVRGALTGMRAVNPSIVVLAGLSTDNAGVPVGVGTMVQDYKLAKGLGVSGFWLNANQWRTHGHGCAPQGCGVTAVTFLQDIGALPATNP